MRVFWFFNALIIYIYIERERERERERDDFEYDFGFPSTKMFFFLAFLKNHAPWGLGVGGIDSRMTV